MYVLYKNLWTIDNASFWYVFQIGKSSEDNTDFFLMNFYFFDLSASNSMTLL